MLLLAATSQAAQPDYVALAMVLVIALIVVIMALRKRFGAKQTKQAEPSIPVEAEVEKPTAPGSAGKVKIHDVEPKTAAMLMAIVADKMDKPLNELHFISIKEVK